MLNNSHPAPLSLASGLLAASLFVQIGCGGGSDDGLAAEATAAKPTPIEVSTTPVAACDVPVVIRATGTFVADESSDVSSLVSGQIVATPASMGDFVRAGQTILRLDDRDARLRLQQVQASLQDVEAQAANASAEVKRNADLVQSGDISRSNYERMTTQVQAAEAGVAQVRAQVAIAQKAVDDTIVRAPFDGHVAARSVAAGEYVTPSSKLATILRLEPIRLQLSIPATDAAKLRTGMGIRAQVSAYPDRTFEGQVTAINPSLNPDSRAMTVEGTFRNADSGLKPGMFATALVQLAQTERAVFVPKSAIVRVASGASSAVYVLDGATAQVRVVQLGDPQDEFVRVLSGIDAGDMLVSTNLNQLYAGASVAPRPAASAAAERSPSCKN